MKRIFLCFISILLSIVSYAQVSVSGENKNLCPNKEYRYKISFPKGTTYLSLSTSQGTISNDYGNYDTFQSFSIHEDSTSKTVAIKWSQVIEARINISVQGGNINTSLEYKVELKDFRNLAISKITATPYSFMDGVIEIPYNISGNLVINASSSSIYTSGYEWLVNGATTKGSSFNIGYTGSNLVNQQIKVRPFSTECGNTIYGPYYNITIKRKLSLSMSYIPDATCWGEGIDVELWGWTPAGTQYVWSYKNCYPIETGSWGGSFVTDTNGEGHITCTITPPGGDPQVLTKSFWVGIPYMPIINSLNGLNNGSITVSSAFTAEFEVSSGYSSVYSKNDYYTWTVNGTVYPNITSPYFSFFVPKRTSLFIYDLSVKAHNVCGTSGVRNFRFTIDPKSGGGVILQSEKEVFGSNNDIIDELNVVSIKIYSLSGTLIYQEEATSSFDIQNLDLEPNLYVLERINQEGIITRKKISKR